MSHIRSENHQTISSDGYTLRTRISLSSKKSKRGRPGARGDLVVDEKQGTLSADGERFLLIPVKLIHAIEDRLTERFGPITATSFQYEIGEEGVAQYVRLAQKVAIR